MFARQSLPSEISDAKVSPVAGRLLGRRMIISWLSPSPRQRIIRRILRGRQRVCDGGTLKHLLVVAGALACLLPPVSASAAARKPSSAEWQFMGAIATGDAAKRKVRPTMVAFDAQTSKSLPSMTTEQALVYAFLGTTQRAFANDFETRGTNGEPWQHDRNSYDVTVKGPCELAVAVSRANSVNGHQPFISKSTVRVDFRKVNRVAARIVDHPVEAAQIKLNQAVGLRTTHRPRKRLQITVFGRGAVCWTNSHETKCSEDDGFWLDHFGDLSVTQSKIDAALKIVKAACPLS